MAIGFHILLIWLAFLVLALAVVIPGVPWICYRYGMKVGDKVGYIRGYKEDQQSSAHAMEAGTFPPK